MLIDRAIVDDLRRVSLGRTGANLVADAAGLLYLLGDEDQQAGRRVVCFDYAGALLWERRYPSPSYPTVSIGPLRVAPDGALWLGSQHCIYQVVAPRQTDPQPVELSNVLRSSEGEHLGTFVVLPDGFIVCLDHPARAPRPPSLTPRVARLNRAGAVQWCTDLPVEPGPFAGDHIGHRGPALPRTWSVDYVSDPLLVLGRRVLVSLCEIGGGAGRSYCLDTETGDLIWQTDTYCIASHAVAGPETFLVSRRGTGLARFNADGELQQQWPTTGRCLVTSDPNDLIRVLPHHGGPGPAYFCHLTADGEVHRGTRLAHSTPRIPRSRPTERPCSGTPGRYTWLTSGLSRRSSSTVARLPTNRAPGSVGCCCWVMGR